MAVIMLVHMVSGGLITGVAVVGTVKLAANGCQQHVNHKKETIRADADRYEKMTKTLGAAIQVSADAVKTSYSADAERDHIRTSLLEDELEKLHESNKAEKDHRADIERKKTRTELETYRTEASIDDRMQQALVESRKKSCELEAIKQELRELERLEEERHKQEQRRQQIGKVEEDTAQSISRAQAQSQIAVVAALGLLGTGALTARRSSKQAVVAQQRKKNHAMTLGAVTAASVGMATMFARRREWTRTTAVNNDLPSAGSTDDAELPVGVIVGAVVGGVALLAAVIAIVAIANKGN
ncbi:Uncharacterized protein PBTT_07124 [Plasmodiophora brassicae]